MSSEKEKTGEEEVPGASRDFGTEGLIAHWRKRQTVHERTVRDTIGLSVTESHQIISPERIPSEEAFGTPGVSAYPEVLIQAAVVLIGDKTNEGQLIQDIALPWFDIIELLMEDPNMAYQIPPRKWEEIIAGAYKKAGFDEVTLTPRSGDYGRDVIAVKRGIGIIRVIDQVKAYKPGHLVTADDVRALMGVLQTDPASKGFLTTTSDFAPRIREDPLITPLIPSRLELINGKMLLKGLEELAKKLG